MFKNCLVFLCGVFFLSPIFASIEVAVDKENIAVDEILTLTISSEDHLHIQPDLSPLEKEFTIVGTSRSMQFNRINGQSQMQAQWQIALLPKHSGEILLPSLQVGADKTPSRLIHVVPVKRNDAQERGVSGHDVFIEASVTPKTSYIQEQLVYTLKLFFSRSIEGPYLIPPELEGAKISQNGQDIIYTTVKGGQYYHVLERSYLITPKNSGRFQIQSPVLKGYVEDAMNRTGLYGFPSQNLKPIKVSGPVINIEVKPKPGHFLGQWLPARQMTFSESWEPTPVVFREGEPVTREIEIRAEGATGEQIPNLAWNAPANVNYYPQSAKRETIAKDNKQIGTLIQKVTYIPTRVGKMTLPATKLHWWNTQTHKEEILIIPPKTIEVLPALANVSHSSKLALTTPSLQQTSSAPSKDHFSQESSLGNGSWMWPGIVTLLTLVWLTTLYLWRRDKRGRSFHLGGQKTSFSSLEKSLQEACRLNQATKARSFFLSWAAQYWGQEKLHTLSEVIQLLKQGETSELGNQIMKLEAIFYSRHQKHWDGLAFWNALQAYIKSEKQTVSVQIDDPLPPLY